MLMWPSQNYVRFEIDLVDDFFLRVKYAFQKNKEGRKVDLSCPMEFQTDFLIGEKENKKTGWLKVFLLLCQHLHCATAVVLLISF